MKKIIAITAVVLLSSCQGMGGKNERMDVGSGHIDTPLPQTTPAMQGIPPIVEQVPVIAAPEPVEKLQTFTVVATDLPANELLFALARDARLNLDVDPSVTDRISINAIDQTLPQILKRISRQASLRYYLDGPNLVVEKDKPFTHVYRVEYLNMSRVTTSSVEVSTQIASTGTSEGGGGGSNSSTTVTNDATNEFWKTLEENFALLANVDGVDGVVISNRESGNISVRTTAAAHSDIQTFLDGVMHSARKQVLIEATVVEVTLNDDFQSGVDWSSISNDGEGWDFSQNLLGDSLTSAPFSSATYTNNNSDTNFRAAIKALDSFGDVSVMSSPKIMALNNQTAVLKVVDNRVYFSTEVEREEGTIADPGDEVTFTTTIHTVPVGFVMNVTPFITDSREVILNIRPTISRILRFVNTPVPDGLFVGVANPIPEIQVREMESVLRVADGNTAVIGGLMQDSVSKSDAGLPGLHDSKGFGFLFGTKSRELTKTELVIFLRPRILDNANVDTNLRDFKRYLKPEAFSDQAN